MKYNRNSTERVHLRFGAGDASQIVFLWAQSPTGKAVRTLTWKKDGTGDAAITKVDDRNFDIAWTAEETKLLSRPPQPRRQLLRRYPYDGERPPAQHHHRARLYAPEHRGGLSHGIHRRDLFRGNSRGRLDRRN